MTGEEVIGKLTDVFRRWIEDPDAGLVFRCERIPRQLPDGRVAHTLKITNETEIGTATVSIETPRIVPASAMPARVK